MDTSGIHQTQYICHVASNIFKKQGLIKMLALPLGHVALDNH